MPPPLPYELISDDEKSDMNVLKPFSPIQPFLGGSKAGSSTMFLVETSTCKADAVTNYLNETPFARVETVTPLSLETSKAPAEKAASFLFDAPNLCNSTSALTEISCPENVYSKETTQLPKATVPSSLNITSCHCESGSLARLSNSTKLPVKAVVSGTTFRHGVGKGKNLSLFPPPHFQFKSQENMPQPDQLDTELLEIDALSPLLGIEGLEEISQEDLELLKDIKF